MVDKAVFLDRDGVINHANIVDGKGYAPRTLEDFELLPQAGEAIHALSNAGFLIFVVTNQPDIGNGLVDANIVQQMHDSLKQSLPIEEIYVCAHKQTEGCDCRKPSPTMITRAMDHYDLTPNQCYMVGDRYSDMQAGEKAGCKTIFIDYKYLETPDFDANFRCKSLFEASQYILSQ